MHQIQVAYLYLTFRYTSLYDSNTTNKSNYEISRRRLNMFSQAENWLGVFCYSTLATHVGIQFTENV